MMVIHTHIYLTMPVLRWPCVIPLSLFPLLTAVSLEEAAGTAISVVAVVLTKVVGVCKVVEETSKLVVDIEETGFVKAEPPVISK